MKTIIKTALSVATLASLTACGGSDSPTITQEVATPETPDACNTELHNEIRGSYNGQIQFQSPDWVQEPSACTWEVELSVSTEADTVGLCQIGFSIDTEVLSGDSDCTDLETSGVINGTYGVNESEPQWPIQLSAVTPMQMQLYSIYATGNARNNGRWEYVFDGRGNISMDEVSESIGYSGVLVRFSDQPDAMDQGVVMEVEAGNE